MSFHKALVYASTDIKISDLRSLTVDMIWLSDEQWKKYKILEKRCTEHTIHMMSGDDENYHFKFHHITSSPYIIYGQGNMELLHKKIIAIVWPRKATAYARQVLEKLFTQLQAYDVVTISGLADGVDMMVHDLSLQYNIPTIAVLWWGLQYYLRSKNREKIQTIVNRGGLVLSEFKLEKGPERYTFPQRNRIVAGLSEMVFLPEAGVKSGSLITVDFARRMHKDIYGTPNTIFSNTSQGLLEYMQAWFIKPVIHIDEMLEKYFWKKINSCVRKVVSSWNDESLKGQETSDIIKILQKNPDWLSIHTLVVQAWLSTEEIMSQLSIAEVMERVRNDGGIWKIK